MISFTCYTKLTQEPEAVGLTFPHNDIKKTESIDMIDGTEMIQNDSLGQKWYEYGPVFGPNVMPSEC